MYNETTLQLNDQVIRKGKTIYRAINHSLRRQIIELIHKKQGMIVTDIYRKLNIEQSVASQHLAILREAKIVTTKRQGQHIYYSVNYDRIKEITQCSQQLLNGINYC